MSTKKKLASRTIQKPKKYSLQMLVTVTIEVNDDEVIRRCTENIDGWREQMYKLYTTEDVLTHFAFNAIANGVTQVNNLDGWANSAKDAAVFTVDRDIEIFGEVLEET